jgi:3-oxoacyl-[acyl-carrier protein] reductase
MGRRWVPFQADLAEPEACERAVEETVESFGRLDVFVANAAIWPSQEEGVAEMSDERWKRTLAVNLDSVFYGTRAALRAMEGGGRVVIVSSTAGQRGEAFHADYAATKGALISFVKSVGVEAAAAGIGVNCVAPGWVDTEMRDRGHDSAGPRSHGRRDRGAYRVPLLGAGGQRGGRSGQRERRQRALRLNDGAHGDETGRAA